MAKFDLENFRDWFIDLFQTNMAAKIAEINAEKGDSLLTDFTADQYFSDMNQRIDNYDRFIFYGFPDIQTINNGRGPSALEVTMAFDIVVAEPEGGTISENIVMRYTRAMVEIVEANSRSNPQIGDVSVEQFAPVSLNDNQLSARMKIGGISIKGTIG